MTVNGETLVPVGAVVLVASRSQPGIWHETTPERCDCLGFHYRGKCRHIAAVAQAVNPAQPKPAESARCKQCGSTGQVNTFGLCFRCQVAEIWGD